MHDIYDICYIYEMHEVCTYICNMHQHVHVIWIASNELQPTICCHDHCCIGARLSSFVDVSGKDMAIADAEANQRNRDRLEPGAPSGRVVESYL